jgi:ParB family chromosome partitioning protein
MSDSTGKRKALGKGLSALLPDVDPPKDAVAEVPVDRLEPNPHQPRQSFDPAALAELAASLRETGMVQPILVRRISGDRYQVIAGERRLRAARQAGLSTVPVTIRDVPDDRLLELALVENIQRAELSALEEAQAYRRLYKLERVCRNQVLALGTGKPLSVLSDETVARVNTPSPDDTHSRSERERLYFEAMMRVLARELPGYRD